MIAVAVFISQQGSRPRGDAPASIHEGGDQLADDWTRPDVIVWSVYDSLSDENEFDEDHQQYELDSLNESLLRVGRCLSNELTLRTRVQVNGYERVGRGGVFWGWERVFGDPDIQSCCWGVEVGRLAPNAPDYANICLYEIGPSGGHQVVLGGGNLQEFQIPALPSAQFEVRVEVTANEVHQVYVNDEPVLDRPVVLQYPGMRDWQRLYDTDYGFLGNFGSFSFLDFEAHQ
jgi:hypothetical protein